MLKYVNGHAEGSRGGLRGEGVAVSVGGGWTGGQEPPGKSQVVIGFITNTGMDHP